MGTAKIDVEEVSARRVVLHIRNRRRVQNHIGGVHAAAIALLAETATGFALSMHLTDDKVPLIKALKIDYIKRARGDLTALTELSPEHVQGILSQESGEITVPVTLTDQSGRKPIRCEAIWAWRQNRQG